MADLSDIITFLDGFEVGVLVFLAEILLFDHFHDNSFLILDRWCTLVLFVLLILKRCSHFLLNIGVRLNSQTDIPMNSGSFGHSFMPIPLFPLSNTNKIHHVRFINIAISNSSLFVKRIEK